MKRSARSDLENGSPSLAGDGDTSADEPIRAVRAATAFVPRISLLDVMSAVTDVITNVDQAAALARVNALRAEYPQHSVQELAELLIKRKSRMAGAVGAATSGAALVPGIGTLFVLAAGTAADVTVVLRMQAELVLEMAAVHRRLLSDEEQQQAILLAIGLSVGANELAVSAGRKATVQLGERFAQRWFVRLLPAVGIAASAGANALFTYVAGARAHAYFGLGPEAVHDWKDGLRAITGVDERKVARWLAEGSVSQAGRRGARAVGGGAIIAVTSVGQAGKTVIGGARGLVRRSPRRRKAPSKPKH